MTELFITLGIITAIIIGAMLIDTAIENYYQRKIDSEFFKNEMDRHIVASILVNRGKKHD